MSADRISSRDLEHLARLINNATGHADEEAWTRDTDGQLHATIGYHYIDGAYGGVALYMMVTDGGGVTDVSRFGHQPKRRLHDFMRGMLEGLEARS